MLTFIRKHKLLSFIVVIAVIYVIQFFLFPNYFPKYYPRSNEASSVLIVPLIALSIVGNVIFDVSVGIWAIVDAIYGIMLCIYHGNGRGHYGIGMRGLALDGNHETYSFELAAITILIFVLFLFTFQFIIRILCLIIKKETKS